ncbi:cytochrome P450 [Mycena albidolilacea]|uniref:Cytochrome P450 n=1 Tax=Mycena albidolilacea TaxID=1033008 RepID=A0AAD6ZIZ4_9AGAR|nr:cytochrome P450 [Mycena albidolilacea]
MTPIVAASALFVVFYGIRNLLRRVFSVLDNLPGPPLKSMITGNLTQFHDHEDYTGKFQRELEQDYGQVVKLHGLFGVIHLDVTTATFTDTIFRLDNSLFSTRQRSTRSWLKIRTYTKNLRSCFGNLDQLLWGPGIFSATRDDHRKYRKIMMPAFSAANLRGMIPIFYEVAEKLDFNPILCRTSLEMIGLAGIGYSFDPMLPGQEPTDRYAEALKQLMPAVFKMALILPVLPFIFETFPSFFLRFMMNLIPLPALHELRDIVDFTHATAMELVRSRKAAMGSGKLDDGGKDVMSLLMKTDASAESGMHLTDAELAAGTSMVLFAATDTTSAAMTRMVHILATYPDVQEKLRAEVLAVPQHLDHDTLVALPYLDGFIREILRLYPPVVSSVFREALADGVLPLTTPITGVDGRLIESIFVPKGTTVHIGIPAANHSKRIWGDDALEFKPERWTNGKANSVTTKLCGVYGNTMTFIGGGRSCIGFKFAQLEMTPVTRVQWRNTGIMLTPHVNDRPELPIVVERLKA